MGRWAQRTRGGGGINAPNYIAAASITGGATARLTYAKPIDAAALTPDDFTSDPSSTQGDVVTQFSDNEVDVSFPSVINTDTEITYTGTVAGITTPQTVIYQ